jgi:hypothetical protein
MWTVEVAVANELHPLVCKRLTEVVQLLQVYAWLAEIEVAAGERPKAGEVGLPEDTGERIRKWAEDEESKRKEGKEMADELRQAMRAHGHDPTPFREAMGG